MEIKTIDKEVTNTLIVEKSKFISFIMPCNSKNEANEIISKMKEKYFDSTHVCYAYILNDEGTILYKGYDDGEPSQTAGAPILNVLKRNNLMNVICIVVRYFGGIKLGAGGLTRTYSNSAISVLDLADVVTLVDAIKITIITTYENNKNVEHIIKTSMAEVLAKRFDMNVEYDILMYNEDDLEKLSKELSFYKVVIENRSDILAKKK